MRNWSILPRAALYPHIHHTVLSPSEPRLCPRTAVRPCWTGLSMWVELNQPPGAEMGTPRPEGNVVSVAGGERDTRPHGPWQQGAPGLSQRPRESGRAGTPCRVAWQPGCCGQGPAEPHKAPLFRRSRLPGAGVGGRRRHRRNVPSQERGVGGCLRQVPSPCCPVLLAEVPPPPGSWPRAPGGCASSLRFSGSCLRDFCPMCTEGHRRTCGCRLIQSHQATGP